MGPKINGGSIAELVKLEVERTVNDQKNELLEIKSRLELSSTGPTSYSWGLWPG